MTWKRITLAVARVLLGLLGIFFLLCFISLVGWTWMRLKALNIGYFMAISSPQPNAYDVVGPVPLLTMLTFGILFLFAASKIGRRARDQALPEKIGK